MFYMSKESSNKEFLPLNYIYPDAKSIFSQNLKPLQSFDTKKTIYVLDTNSLVLPYNISKQSLREIKQTYSKLVNEERLIIPGQVAREFAKIRNSKISTIYQGLSQYKEKVEKISLDPIKVPKYPLFENIDAYNEILKLEKDQSFTGIIKSFSDFKKIYISNIDKILQQIKTWDWKDPVSSLYSEIFTDKVIYDLTLDDKKLKEIHDEMNLRYQYEIPPGYKDDKKEDNRIGDFLIWKSILNIAEERKEDIIFVSGEKKVDWWLTSYKSETLYPRYELIYEFNQISNGKSFYIIELSELLKIHGAKDSIVEEIHNEELAINTYETTNLELYIKDKTDSKSAVLYTIYTWLVNNFSGQVRAVKSPNIVDYVIKESGIKRTAICIVYLDLINPETIIESIINIINSQAEIYNNMEKRLSDIAIFFVSKSTKQSQFIREVILEWAFQIQIDGIVNTIFIGDVNKDGIIGTVYQVLIKERIFTER